MPADAERPAEPGAGVEGQIAAAYDAHWGEWGAAGYGPFGHFRSGYLAAQAKIAALEVETEGYRVVLRALEDTLAQQEGWTAPGDAWNWHAAVVSQLRLVRAALARPGGEGPNGD